MSKNKIISPHKSRDKSGYDSQTGIPELIYSDNYPSPNWGMFKESLTASMMKKYPELGVLFKTGKFFTYPEPVMPEDMNSHAGHMYKHACAETIKREFNARSEKRMMYVDLWSVLPRAMQDALESREDHIECVETPCDVQLLWQRVTLLATAGATRLMVENHYEVTKTFANLSQRSGEKLIDFKTRVRHCVEMHEVIGLPLPDPAMVVTVFLKGASDELYGEAKANLRYVTKERMVPLPRTLEEAYLSLESRAAEYNHQYRRTQVHATFAANETNRQSTTAIKKPARDTHRQTTRRNMYPYRKNNTPPECRICKAQGINGVHHWHDACPNKGKTLVAFMSKSMSKPPLRKIGNRDEPAEDGDPEDDYIIRLDSQSDRHLFHNAELLDDIQATDPIVIRGIGNHQVLCKQVGRYGPIKDILFCDQVGANILSLALMRDQYKVEFETKEDTMTAWVQGNRLVFRRVGNHYEMRANSKFDNLPECCLTIFMPTTRDLEAQYSNAQIQRFRKAGELFGQLGFPSPKRLLTAIKFGLLKNNEVDQDDVMGYLSVYGNVPYLKGKMTDHRVRPRPYVPIFHNIQRLQKLHADIMFVAGEPFLITVSEPLKLVMTRKINGRNKAELDIATNEVVSAYKARNFVITELSFDMEGGMKALKGMLSNKGIVYDPVAPGVHESTAERHIRTTKDSIRSVLASLPYPVPPSELHYLVSFCVSRMNMMPSESRVDPTSPVELFTGYKPDASQLGPAFGTYCEVFLPNVGNKIEPRAASCICLGANSGSPNITFLNLETMQTIQSVKYQALNAIPQSVIDKMIARSKQQCVGTDPEQTEREVIITDPEKTPPLRDSITNDDAGTTSSTPTPVIGPRCYTVNPEAAIDEWVASKVQSKLSCYNVTYQTAKNSWGSEAIKALRSEIQSMLDKQVFIPAVGPIKRSIMSFVFFKAKHDANGKFIKLKARLVAGGHQQNKAQYENISSPTCALQSVFTVAATSAMHGRVVSTLDIATAYLNANIERDDLYMSLDKDASDMLVELDPTYEVCRRPSGRCAVLLKKALYGCLESALLWYRHIHDTLTQAGYTQNQYDKCVYQGEGAVILVYVDDVFISAIDEESKDRVIKVLKDKYVTVTINQGSNQCYLGMDFNFYEGTVNVSMKRQIEEVLSGHEVGIRASPCTKDLFNVTESNNLSRDYLEKYHSCVAKLMYIAKRTRPDILTTVAFLSTRVQSPTKEDQEKLNRLLAYLNGTRDRSVTLGVNPGVQLVVYVDASYHVHPDMRSHGGIFLTLGRGPIFVKSFKHKLVAKSSTEAELIALAEATDIVAWMRYFLESIGYPQKPTVVYQDNQSTMMIAKNGPSGVGKSKHIQIRYFAIKELVDDLRVTLKYLPTGEMIADALTKPLVGSNFRRLSSLLQGEVEAEHHVHETKVADGAEEPC